MGAWTNRDATQVKDVPASLLILGGGVVGAEMATAYQRLGAQVTLVQHGERLLPTTEPEAGRRVQAALEADGVDVRLGTSMTRGAPGGLRGRGFARRRLRGARRGAARRGRPALHHRPTSGWRRSDWSRAGPLATDESTTVLGDWLYAVGDASTGAKLTHMGKYQARICGDVIVARAHGKELGGRYSHHAATAEHTAVPQVIFTDPQVAAVGHTETSARDAGLTVRAVSYEIGNTAGGSLQADGYDGYASIVVDTEREVSSARRSSGRTSRTWSTARRSRSSARSRSAGCGTRCPRSRR